MTLSLKNFETRHRDYDPNRPRERIGRRHSNSRLHRQWSRTHYCRQCAEERRQRLVQVGTVYVRGG